MKSNINNISKAFSEAENNISKQGIRIERAAVGQTNYLTYSPETAYAYKGNTYVIHEALHFHINDRFYFYSDTTGPGYPENGNTIIQDGIKSIEVDKEGLILLSKQGNLIAELKPGEPLYNLPKNTEFYIASIKDFDASNMPNVKVVLNYYTPYTDPTTPIYCDPEKSEMFKIMED